MSHIRSCGNKATELRMITILRSAKIKGWRRQRPVFGKPDFVFRSERTAIFVDGCFWHGCPRCYRCPSSNEVFWKNKYKSNRHRDKTVSKTLRSMGWKVLRIWEHELRDDAKVSRRIRKVLNRCPIVQRPKRNI